MMIQKKLKLRNLIAALIVIFLFTPSVKAAFADREARFLFQAGTYDFTATSRTTTGNVSGFGSFTFGAEYAFLDHFQLMPAITI